LFTEEVLDEIKEIYISKLKDRANKKTYILKKKINEVLGTNNPYGVDIESNIEDISNVTLADVKRVYETIFSSKCSIYVVGQVDNDKLISAFDFIKLKENTDELEYSYLKTIEESKYEYESKFLQSAISLIYECNIIHSDRLYYASKVFVEMLNYDLFNIIREKYNYCYYIYAISNNYLNTIEIVSEIESKNFEDVIRITNEIIDGYKEDKTSDFLVTKNKILNLIKSNEDNARDMALVYFGFDFNKSVSSIEELKNKYEAVNYEEVKEVSKMMKLKMASILKEANHE
jgi:predicted Zn-dependent peptidase